MKNLFLLTLMAALSFGCQKSDLVNLHGNIENAESVKIFRLYPDSISELETVSISGNQFDYSLEEKEESFLLVRVDENHTLPLLVQNGESVTVNFDASQQYPAYEVFGSPESEKLAMMNYWLIETYSLADSLDQESKKAQDMDYFPAVRMTLDSIFRSRLEKHITALKEFIENDSTSLTCIIAFNHSIGGNQFLTPQTDLRYYEMVANGLNAMHPNNMHTTAFISKLNEVKEALKKDALIQETQEKLMRSAIDRDYALPGLNGDSLNLKNIEGELILLDFWASWCQPCRRENPFLVSLYEKYHPKGFNIFSVSLDGVPQQPDPKGDWTKAIEADSLVWDFHVSDLKGWNSEVIPKFGLSAIPYNYLMTADGKIIGRNLRGQELEDAIVAYFKG